MSEQHEEESLRRWAREQAEIERQTDALVLRTLTAMVTAAEDLKSKLRRDTEALLEEYRKNKRSLENEISLATAERQRFRREIDQEREAVLADAHAEARDIVEAAEREREAMLRETRDMEQRLRGIEEQIRSIFGQAGGPNGEQSAAASAADEDEDDAPTSSRAAAAFTATPLGRAGAAPPTASTAAPSSPATPASATPPPTAPAPFPPPVSQPIADADDEEQDDGSASALVEDEAELIDEDEAAPTASLPQPAFTPAPPPPVVSMPAPAPAPQPAAAAQRRLVELVFDNVPGYQQASALERAVDDLVPDGEVDILDFERGQLVLNVHVTDLDGLAEQLVATSTAVRLELESVEENRATFHCS